MLPGAASRLPSSYPLRRALDHAHPGEPLGAWVRLARWPLHLRAGGRALLAATDLGYLLRRCAAVLVRQGEHPLVIAADRLIAWRTLQIVIGAPYLPAVRELRAIYPGLRVQDGRLALPLGLDGAEPALAACAAARIPVAATWIEYHDAGSG
ncbi:MAG TPA: hypothetical protein VMY76_07190 [Gemmatimonadales bacterium]|nr:hypothetical protein [Gemmatimonadales bacterium]